MIEATQDEGLWGQWCAEAGVRDPYWSWSHLALWAPEWEAEPLGIRWTADGEVLLHPVLKVPLDRLVGGEGRHDLRTAYDFAGPLHLGRDAQGAMARFEEAWTAWAREAGTVTEFLRLHPFALSARPSWATLHGHNHVVELRQPYEQIRSAYHSSWRRNLRKAEAGKLTVEVSQTPRASRIDRFSTMYSQSMERLDVLPEFHFRNETLRRFLSLPDSALVSVLDPGGSPLAMATVLASGSILFYHLGCSDPDRLSLRPNHRLFDGMVRMGLDGGFSILHLGGGSASLRHFKAQLASGTVPYYLARRVLDAQAYGKLCQSNGVDPAGSLFPAYLGRLKG